MFRQGELAAHTRAQRLLAKSTWELMASARVPQILKLNVPSRNARITRQQKLTKNALIPSLQLVGLLLPELAAL